MRVPYACSFGVIPTTPLAIHTPLMPSQSIEVSLPLNTIGPVMKMDPLNNLQVKSPVRTGRVRRRLLSKPGVVISRSRGERELSPFCVALAEGPLQ